MTREEAIADIRDNIKPVVGGKSLEMAIKALEQEPCEDVISREEAIDACNQSVNILEATDRIKDLPPVSPKQKISRWIPVSERLPEEHDGYLITVKQGYVRTALWIGNAEYWNEVIAWMPLPKPYKTESEDDNEMSVSDKSNS